MSGRFVLIASYPKSGNTWMRLVLEKLQRGSDFAVNNLDANFYGIVLRLVFDSIAPVNAADLRPDEIELFLPYIYRQIAIEIPDRVFVKVHDMARRNREGEWMFPPDCVQSVIYIVRHPFDVAVSAANHFGISVEYTVALMGDEELTRYARRRLPEALPQWFGTWSTNVASWLDSTTYDVSFARYEDILSDPVAGFRALVRAAGFAVDDSELAATVEELSFERLRKYETERGFSEKPATSQSFFRAGQSRSWEGVLSAELRDCLVNQHGDTMRRLGYAADGSCEPLDGGRENANRRI